MNNTQKPNNTLTTKLPDIQRNLDEDQKSRKLTFTSYFIILSVALIALLFIALIFGGIGQSNKREIAEGIQELRLNTTRGELVFKYKIYDRDGRKILVVVTNRLDDQVSISNLITNIIYSENLTLRETDVMLLGDKDLEGLSIEEYFAKIENKQDPTNPLFVDADLNHYEGEEKIEPIDFGLYIGNTNYSDNRFSITALDETSYRVELKNGFTEDQFREDFLSQFLNTENLTFIYVDQNDLRLQNP
jgi:cell division protein FtsI/penicillin-binding protein 2